MLLLQLDEALYGRLEYLRGHRERASTLERLAKLDRVTRAVEDRLQTARRNLLQSRVQRLRSDEWKRRGKRRALAARPFAVSKREAKELLRVVRLHRHAAARSIVTHLSADLRDRGGLAGGAASSGARAGAAHLGSE